MYVSIRKEQKKEIQGSTRTEAEVFRDESKDFRTRKWGHGNEQTQAAPDKWHRSYLALMMST